jgi:hypothetical protein
MATRRANCKFEDWRFENVTESASASAPSCGPFAQQRPLAGRPPLLIASGHLHG